MRIIMYKEKNIYYYGTKYAYEEALNSKSMFTKAALADVIVNYGTESVIKCRYPMHTIFDKFFGGDYEDF